MNNLANLLFVAKELAKLINRAPNKKELSVVANYVAANHPIDYADAKEWIAACVADEFYRCDGCDNLYLWQDLAEFDYGRFCSEHCRIDFMDNAHDDFGGAPSRWSQLGLDRS